MRVNRYRDNMMRVLREIADTGQVEDEFDLDIEGIGPGEVIAYIHALNEEGLVTGNISFDGFADVIPTAAGLRMLDESNMFENAPWPDRSSSS